MGYVNNACKNNTGYRSVQYLYFVLQRLVDSGASLPASVHVIDAACLLKQFLRCLPDPLLPTDVHTKLACCLHVTVEEQRMEAMVLCTLLLPRPHQHTLIYLMDVCIIRKIHFSQIYSDRKNQCLFILKIWCYADKVLQRV